MNGWIILAIVLGSILTYVGIGIAFGLWGMYLRGRIKALSPGYDFDGLEDTDFFEFCIPFWIIAGPIEVAPKLLKVRRLKRAQHGGKKHVPLTRRFYALGQDFEARQKAKRQRAIERDTAKRARSELEQILQGPPPVRLLKARRIIKNP